VGIKVGVTGTLNDYAVRLFYLGEAYHGSQQQPNVRTIQGELIRALTAWSGISHTPQTVRFSGRTDKGVHSIGQIAVISSDVPVSIDKINRYLPDDIILWAIAQPPLEFQPRFDALMRHYRYFLDDSWQSVDLIKVREAIPMLIGSNDLGFLSKPEPGRNTITTVLNIAVANGDDIRSIDFFGTSFLWKFVRKTVTILKEIGLGNAKQSIFKDLLDGDAKQIRGGIEPAPPENLFLVETAVPFRLASSKYALRKMRICLRDRIEFHGRTLTSYSGAMKHFTA
jgi:tRNA pseudouridine38-40 synthase